MQTKILITGGTGLVGKTLARYLSGKGYDVRILSRKIPLSPEFKTQLWNIASDYIDQGALDVDHIIHLAGAGVADKRWTKDRKKLLYDSRIESTKFLYKEILKLKNKPKSFICASAIGIYGFDTGEKWVEESSPSGDDFLAKLVLDWEHEADRFNTKGVQTAFIRIGIVLSEQGGALPKLAAPIRYGLGAPIGSGKQYLSWVHINDLCKIFGYAVEGQINGPVNAVAPDPRTNKEFSKTVARTLGRPFWLPNVPAFLLRLFLGQMSSVITRGNRVSSSKLVSSGFEFDYPELEPALQDLLIKKEDEKG